LPFQGDDAPQNELRAVVVGTDSGVVTAKAGTAGVVLMAANSDSSSWCCKDGVPHGSFTEDVSGNASALASTLRADGSRFRSKDATDSRYERLARSSCSESCASCNIVDVSGAACAKGVSEYDCPVDQWTGS
jgi:hypothetical protein